MSDDKTMITCEIANPSDLAHIRGTRRGIQGAVLALGRGKYGAVDTTTGTHVLPIFLFGGYDSWAKSEWGHDDLKKVLDDHADEVIVALESVRLGGPEALDEPGDRIAIKEGRRSSMNDIAGRAWRYAEILRDRQGSSTTSDAADARGEDLEL